MVAGDDARYTRIYRCGYSKRGRCSGSGTSTGRPRVCSAARLLAPTVAVHTHTAAPTLVCCLADWPGRQNVFITALYPPPRFFGILFF